MKIGVWLGKYNNPQIGGGFSYVDRLISAIDSFQFDPMIEICFISERECTRHLNKKVLLLKRNSHVLLSFLFFIASMKIINCRIKGYLEKIIYEKRRSEYTEQLVANEIKIIYYLQQAYCVLPDFPFISSNWDIGHCSTYAFPEISLQKEYEERACWYRDYMPRALFVFAESEAGKRELINYTNVNASKIKVVPIFSGACVKQIIPIEQQIAFLKSKEIVKEKYFFYPAQFWAHKNHIGLLKAFSFFLRKYPDFKLVLTGSDKGTFSHVMKRAGQLNIQNSISYLGFVSTEEIYILYRNATSLVMPTYFGSTNMPPLEAMELGCPVICSDLPGHREELGSAAIYFNPMDSNEIANAMIEVFLNRDTYKSRIREQANKTPFTIDNALKAIDKNLCEAVIIRDSW